jgi:hypothetical protein
MAFGSGGAERMRIDSDGDVGIGTTAPTTIFHVQQNNTANIGMRMRQLSTTQFAGAGLLCNGPVSSSTQGGTAFYHYNRNTGGTNGALAMAQFDENGSFQRSLAEYYYNEQAWLFYTNGSERLRIDSSGNVGIGNISPGAKLDVTGNIRLSAAGPNIEFNAGGGMVYGPAGNTLAFATGGGPASPVERMRIDSSGNVGIGTTAPSSRLEVNSLVTLSGGESSQLRWLISGKEWRANAAAGGNWYMYDATNNKFPFTIEGNTPNDTLRLKSTGGITSANVVDAVGYKGVPQNAQTSTYTLALSDMGKHISITTGGVVIPANGSVAFPIGSTITVYNNSGTAQNISITTDTLRLAGTATSGTRSLAQRGLATCIKVAATEWVVTGNVT